MGKEGKGEKGERRRMRSVIFGLQCNLDFELLFISRERERETDQDTAQKYFET